MFHFSVNHFAVVILLSALQLCSSRPVAGADASKDIGANLAGFTNQQIASLGSQNKCAKLQQSHFGSKPEETLILRKKFLNLMDFNCAIQIISGHPDIFEYILSSEPQVSTKVAFLQRMGIENVSKGKVYFERTSLKAVLEQFIQRNIITQGSSDNFDMWMLYTFAFIALVVMFLAFGHLCKLWFCQ